MVKRLAFLISCMLVSAPAVAGEAERPRLVVGGMNLSQSDVRTELFATSGFTAGAVSAFTPGAAASNPVETGRDRMALGGYAAYAFRDLQLSSAVMGDGTASSADFSAAYMGGVMGVNGVASVTLGYEWGKGQAFSVNPAQAGLTAFSGAYDPAHSLNDVSLTLSFTHDVTPSLSLGGFAAANRKDGEGEAVRDLHFGAGVGYKF